MEAQSLGIFSTSRGTCLRWFCQLYSSLSEFSVQKVQHQTKLPRFFAKLFKIFRTGVSETLPPSRQVSSIDFDDNLLCFYNFLIGIEMGFNVVEVSLDILIIPNLMSVQTFIGKVTTISKDDPVPEGWRTLYFEEGQTLQKLLSSFIGEWDIVRFGDHGKLDGSGHGNNLSEEAGPEAGRVFIIKL